MSTEWMGRYRNLVAALVRNTNNVNRTSKRGVSLENGVFLSTYEWQVFEYLIENKNSDDRMILISDRLGIPQSSFSRIVSNLCQNNLVVKLQLAGNNKNYVLKPTALGEELYTQHVYQNTLKTFAPFFKELDVIDDETLAVFTKAMSVLADNIGEP